MKKIGIMGGTFNPIHFAHLVLAEHARSEFHLDEIMFIPAGRPPHKSDCTLAANEHRLKMVELAIASNPNFAVCDYEVKKSELSYTADTLAYLCEQMPDCDFNFIIGGDSLLDFHLWNRPDQILGLSTILACGRDGFSNDAVLEKIAEMNQNAPGKVKYFSVPEMSVSSHFIRDEIKANHSVRYYLPNEVNHYILKNHLYR